MATEDRDFTSAPRRGKFEAWMLDAASGRIHAQHGKRKTEVIGAMSGTVVEIGPGSGANMQYYAPGVRVIGIEPNPAMHDRLRANADQHGVDLEIRTLRGEQIDVAEGTADGVVATLVLCGVGDPAGVLSEVRRVLKPGGAYFFIEHVAAAPGSRMRRFQHLVNSPHRWTFNGCEVHRDTQTLLEAAGFASLDLDNLVMRPGLYMPDFIAGTATA
jgi:SAM-dependent methyltransferase